MMANKVTGEMKNKYELLESEFLEAAEQALSSFNGDLLVFRVWFAGKIKIGR